MDDEAQRQDDIRLMIKKGYGALKTSKDIFSKGDYEAASARAYYAVFHLLQAVLLSRGLAFSKHSGVIGAFLKEFIKSGIFPRDFAEIIKRLREDREIGDYDYYKTISHEEAEHDIMDAERIVKALEAYLKGIGI